MLFLEAKCSPPYDHRLVHNSIVKSTRFLLAAAAVIAGWWPSRAEAQLRVPDGQTVLFTARGVGVQIYVSKPSATVAGAFEWSFKAPEAVLLDSDDQKVGKHYAGPTWEANDGSRAVGKKLTSMDSPKPGAIPWLLIKADPAAQSGIMAEVTYIMRVDTSGGAPPTRPSHGLKDQARVKYRATYLFFGAAGQDKRAYAPGLHAGVARRVATAAPAAPALRWVVAR